MFIFDACTLLHHAAYYEHNISIHIWKCNIHRMAGLLKVNSKCLSSMRTIISRGRGGRGSIHVWLIIWVTANSGPHIYSGHIVFLVIWSIFNRQCVDYAQNTIALIFIDQSELTWSRKKPSACSMQTQKNQFSFILSKIYNGLFQNYINIQIYIYDTSQNSSKNFGISTRMEGKGLRERS